MINITQQPTEFYPAYNDSFLKFTTSYGDDDRAVIKLDDTYQFTVFPYSDGNYLFNMREVVKAIVNTNQFKDEIDVSGAGWGYSDSSLHKEIEVSIMAYGDGTSEGTNSIYSFTKAAKQYGDKQFNNPYQLLLPSEDGINYHLTYFEGYPFEIPFRFLSSTDNITIYNQRTKQLSTQFTPAHAAAYRLYIDKGLSNWNSSGVLDIPDMMSRLDVRVNGVVKNTIELTKKADECGIYLKWFNGDGSYSYWLFHQWYKQDYSAREIDRIATNNFSNIYENTEGLSKITGKGGETSMKLKTTVTAHEKNQIESLFTSPKVQMWSEKSPYQDGEWVDVKVVSNGFTFNNKRTRNHINVEIELPERITQTL